MKKDRYDQHDKLFKEVMNRYLVKKEISDTDKDLFISWIEHLDTKKQSIQTIVKTNKENTPISQDNSTLFTEWVNKNSSKISLYTQYKNSEVSIPNKKKEKNTIPVIDLHGYKRHEAIHKFKKFLYSLPPHTAKVRVIHGKGISSGQPSVIRSDIRNWLLYKRESGNWIVDFSYEIPENGGHGATIIWLKQGANNAKY